MWCPFQKAQRQRYLAAPNMRPAPVLNTIVIASVDEGGKYPLPHETPVGGAEEPYGTYMPPAATSPSVVFATIVDSSTPATCGQGSQVEYRAIAPGDRV